MMMPIRILMLLVIWLVMPLPYGRGSVSLAWSRFKRFHFSAFFSSVIKLATALRATCSFRLSGFTRNISVSSAIHADNGPYDSARGQHLAAVLERLQHLLLLLLLALHGHEDQQIEDGHQRQRKKQGPSWSCFPWTVAASRARSSVMFTDGCSVSEYHTSKSPLEMEFKEYSGGMI